MTKSQNIYDNQDFFNGYKTLRENQYSANDREEKPALFSLAPSLRADQCWIWAADTEKTAPSLKRWELSACWA